MDKKPLEGAGMKTAAINCHKITVVENEYLYGPGKRLLIFMQGCSLRCKGCVNRHLWEFGSGKDFSSDEILTMCKNNDVEGITLHGGEPLDQANALFESVSKVKKEGFSIVLFTGYLKRELNKTQIRIWDRADLVVSGRYEESKRNIYQQFRGSTNQHIYKHGDRYKNLNLTRGKTVAIINIDVTGRMEMLGFKSESIEALLQEAAKTKRQA